jgi:hypothetical protein
MEPMELMEGDIVAEDRAGDNMGDKVAMSMVEERGEAGKTCTDGSEKDGCCMCCLWAFTS